MGNIIRIGNGQRVQVRTGVLAGVGPQGPVGPAGPTGPQGEQGPVGDQGPIGQILQVSSRALVSETPVLSGKHAVPFNAIDYDDSGVFTSSTQMTINAAGDYLVTVYMSLYGSQANSLLYLERDGIPYFVQGLSDGYGGLSTMVRGTPGQVLTVSLNVPSGDTIDQGAVTVTRIGSGPQGPAGPQGPQGLQGIQGIQGPAGPAGSASGGFATYADLY